MSVQTEITRIESAKTAIATAIEGKGVTVPTGTKLDGLAALVESIEAGGGDMALLGSGSFTLSEEIKPIISNTSGENGYTLELNLGVMPKFIIIGGTPSAAYDIKRIISWCYISNGNLYHVHYSVARYDSSHYYESLSTLISNQAEGKTWDSSVVRIGSANIYFALNTNEYKWLAYG